MKEILLGILCIVIMLVSLFAPIMLIPFVTKMIEWISNKVNQLLDWICSCIKSVCYFIIERNKIQKKLALVIIVVIVIGLCFGPSVIMPSVMKYPHNLVLSFSSDVIENESNVLRRNINDTVENVNIDIKQSNENVGKKEDYIKKEYLDSATYSYNVINTISGILVPLFTFIALVVAYNTFLSQKKQLEIQEQQLKEQKEQADKQLKNQEQQLKNQKQQYELSVFENHLFHMIEQQHKLEEKVVDKYGSFRELYKKFSKICSCVFYDMGEDFNEVVKGNDKRNEIGLKIANYIFYFGADEYFMCDKTFKILTDEEREYKLDKVELKKLIDELHKKKEIEIINDLFHTQKSEELGIYYRNLFNAIRYIDWECPYDDEEKKKEYAKLVRTNLSDFAQLMLYYNMQGERGSAWLDKDEVKDPKGDEDGYYLRKNKDGKLVRVKDCLLTRYKPIKNCAISLRKLEYDTNSIIDVKVLFNMISNINKELDIDPRNDGRRELFSDDVIDYELKIEEKTGDN